MAMNQRERFLAIGVGVIVGALGIHYGYRAITKPLEAKQKKVAAVQKKIRTLKQTITRGKVDTSRTLALTEKSLPSDPQAVNTDYRAWLTTIGKEAGIKGLSITPGTRPFKRDGFIEYAFTLSGKCKTDQALEFMAKFYDRDCLHSLRSVNLAPVARELDMFRLTIEARALALKGAKKDQSPSLVSSGRLAMSVDDYKASILGRNPFSPPNQEPSISTSGRQEITVGSSWRETLEATDKEGHSVSFEIVGEIPDGMRLRGDSLSFRPEETGEHEILVRATDGGFPAKSTEKRIRLVVKEEEKRVEAPEKAEFDAATQAFVTAVLNGAQGPQAWIHSRTESRRIDVTAGDKIEVGTINANVVSINVNESFIELETDGAHWTIGMNSSLAEGFQKSQVD